MRILLCLIFGAVLAGCATTGNVQQGEAPGIHKYLSKERFDSILRDARMKECQKSFKDSFNGRRIIVRNNDLHVEDLDGSEPERITRTPEIKKTFAFFTKDGKRIFYRTTDGDFMTDEYYLLSLESEGRNTVQISEEEYNIYWTERFKQ